MEHVLSLSYGKDSLACLGAIEELGWPLDRIIHAEVWAFENGYDDSLSIDRINPFGNYEPNNCRWITIGEQRLNQRRNYRAATNG